MDSVGWDIDYAEWLAELEWCELPHSVQVQSKRCLKDVLGVAAGSLAVGGATRLATLVESQFGTGRSKLWFSGRGSSLVGAAYHNAMVVDSLDGHDGFRPAKGHAGATVVPVALACADGMTVGSELLTAIVVGYEVACRAGLVVHEMYRPAYHASGSWSALGAAAAGARLRGVAPAQWDGVVGAAEYYAPMSPMLRCISNPTSVKDAAGGGALAAATALAMSEQHMFGPPSLFTSETSGQLQARTLGERWLITEQYFKPYPTCRWTHPAVEGAWRLQQAYGLSPSDIDEIVVETFRAATEAVMFPPRDTHEAQYSLPWAVAVALIDGRLSIGQVSEDRLGDPEVVRLGRRIRVRVAQDLEERFPEECLARVSISMGSGVSHHAPAASARGDPSAPLSSEELDAKFECYVRSSLGDARARALSEAIAALENLPAYELLEQLV